MNGEGGEDRYDQQTGTGEGSCVPGMSSRRGEQDSGKKYQGAAFAKPFILREREAGPTIEAAAAGGARKREIDLVR